MASLRNELLVLGASLGICLSLLMAHSTGTGEIQDFWTDHLHHARAAYTFFHVGFLAYEKPFGQVGASVPYPHDVLTWGEWPVQYPIGMAVLFAVPAYVGKLLSTKAEFGRFTTAYLVVVCHLSMLAVGLALKKAGALRWSTWLCVGGVLVGISMFGFYDAAWVGLGALSAWELGRKRPGASLLYFALAFFTNYRAASLLPIGAWAAFEILFGKGSFTKEKWKKSVASLAISIVLGLLTIYTFVLFFRGSPQPGSPHYQSISSPLLQVSGRSFLVVGVGALAAFLVARRGDWLAALCVLWSTAWTLAHAGAFWHGCMVLAPVLAAGHRALRVDSGVRTIVLVWTLGIFHLGYDYSPFHVLRAIEKPVASLCGFKE